MEVKRIKREKYFFTSKTGNFVFDMYLDGEDLIFFFQEHNSWPLLSYKSSFSLKFFRSLDKRFLSFEKLEKIQEKLEEVIMKKKFSIEKEDKNLVMFIEPFDSKLKIIINLITEDEQTNELFLIANYPKITQGIIQIKRMISGLFRFKTSVETLLEENLKIKSNPSHFNCETDKRIQDAKKEANISLGLFETFAMRTQSTLKKPWLDLMPNLVKERAPKLFNVSKLEVKKTLKSSDFTPVSICLLQDGRLAAISSNKTIKIFNLTTNTAEIVIRDKGRDAKFISLSDDGYLVSASYEEISIYDIFRLSYRRLKVIKVINSYINKVIKISNNRLCSCSTKDISIWNVQIPFERINIFTNPKGTIFSIIELKNRKYIVSGSSGEEKSIKFWDQVTGKRKTTIEDIGCSSPTDLLEVGYNKILVGGKGEITLINGLIFKIEKKFVFPLLENVRVIMDINSGRFLCTCGRKLCEVEISTKKSTINEKLSKDDSEIFDALLLKNNKVILCLKDGSIKILSE